jgi:hypothetical protein
MKRSNVFCPGRSLLRSILIVPSEKPHTLRTGLSSSRPPHHLSSIALNHSSIQTLGQIARSPISTVDEDQLLATPNQVECSCSDLCTIIRTLGGITHKYFREDRSIKLLRRILWG